MRCTPNFSTLFFDVHHNSNNTVFSVADYGHTAFTYVNKSDKGYIFLSKGKISLPSTQKALFSKAANT